MMVPPGSEEKLLGVDHEGELLVVTPQCNVTGSAEANLKSEVDALVGKISESATRGVVVDFGQTSYFGSCMLEAMLSLWRSLSQRKGRMALCNVSPEEREILAVTKFDTLWSTYGSRDEAVAAVRD